MIHTHTMSQLKTVQEPMKLLSATNIDVVLTATNYSTNAPQTSAPVAAGSQIIIPNTSLNYLKIVPVVQSSTTSPQIKVTGWNKVVDSSGATIFWVPQCLFASGAMTKNTTDTFTINSVLFNRMETIPKLQGDGKVFNATSTKDTAFVLVDTVGCELIEVEFIGSGGKANAFYGAI